MKFQADRDVLLNLLSKAAGTVSNKEVQPILKNFLIKAEGDSLACLSTDMSLGALAEIPLPTIAEEGTVCAPAKKLLEMAKTAPAGLMKLELDGRLLAIYTNVKDNDPKKPYQNKWELHCEDGALYPEFPKFDETKAQTAQRDTFVQGINRVSFAAADSELKINLMGVYVNNGWLYAADGHRAAKMKYDSPLQDIMIPAPAVKMLVSVLRDSQTPEVKVFKTKFHLLFKVGNDIFHTRLLEAQFPDIEKRVFSDTDGYTNVLVTNRNELRRAIKRSQVTASEETKALDLVMSGGQLSLKSSNTKDDKYEEHLDAQWNGGDFERTINWEFFEDVATALSKDDVTIKFMDDQGNKKSKFRIEEGDFVAVVMPLRIKKDAQGNVERLHDRVKGHAEAKEVEANLATP